jgi:hypothetical protein
MSTAREEAEQILFATGSLRQVVDAIEAALTSAREAGRVEGREEAAKAADFYEEAWTDDDERWGNAAAQIAVAIRAIKREPRP